MISRRSWRASWALSRMTPAARATCSGGASGRNSRAPACTLSRVSRWARTSCISRAMASRASRWAWAARSSASASARRARSRRASTSWRRERTSMPQAVTSRMRMKPMPIDSPVLVVGSGRTKACTVEAATASAPIQATSRKGRRTATLNRLARRAPAATGATTFSSESAMASPVGQRRRSQRAQQAAAPSSWSTRVTVSLVYSALVSAATRPTKAARRKSEVSTTQSRTVRRGRAAPLPPGPARWEGSSQRCRSVRFISAMYAAGGAVQGTIGPGRYRSRGGRYFGRGGGGPAADATGRPAAP